MAMSPVGTGTKNDSAGKAQQQLIRIENKWRRFHNPNPCNVPVLSEPKARLM
jgi:hypothetical protein